MLPSNCSSLSVLSSLTSSTTTWLKIIVGSFDCDRAKKVLQQYSDHPLITAADYIVLGFNTTNKTWGKLVMGTIFIMYVMSGVDTWSCRGGQSQVHTHLPSLSSLPPTTKQAEAAVSDKIVDLKCVQHVNLCVWALTKLHLLEIIRICMTTLVVKQSNRNCEVLCKMFLSELARYT